MSVILNYDPERIAKVFFGSDLSDVKGTVIITLGTPSLFKRLNRRITVVKRSKGWWNLSVMKVDGYEATLILVGSGPSDVTDVVRLLTKFPVQNIVGIRLAGALKSNIQIGDVLVPTSCVKAFVKDLRKAIPHSEELYWMYKAYVEEFCAKMGVSLHHGGMCTIDAITSETGRFYSYAKSLDILGVDLETFYLYKEARKAGFKVSALHVISDNPAERKGFLNDMPEDDVMRKRKVYGKLPSLVESIVGAIPLDVRNGPSWSAEQT